MAWTITMNRLPARTDGAAPTGAAKPIAASSNPDAAILVLLLYLIRNPHRDKEQVAGALLRMFEIVPPNLFRFLPSAKHAS
jgi:hypothetical protein